MQATRPTYLIVLIAAVIALNGCAWTKRTWNRVWGKEPAATQEREARHEAEAPDIVTGAEGDTVAQTAGNQPNASATAAVPSPATATPTDIPSAPAATPAPPAAPMPPTATAQPVPAPTEPATPAAPASPSEVVSLQADAVFAFGKSDLTSTGRAKLDEMIAKLDKSKLAGITVVGHADRIGAADRNQVLSERRANAVRDYLVAQGLNGGIIRTEGRGAADPVVNCPGEKVTPKLISCLAANRRVEVMINSAR